MEPTGAITDSLKSVGISAGVISVLMIIGVGAFLYKNYLEMEKIKLQIALYQIQYKKVS